MSEPYIAVDLDGTLARFERWLGPMIIGPPIPKMVERVKNWLAEGEVVKIMTARITAVPGLPFDRAASISNVQDWCEKHIGKRLDVISEKDYLMLQLWDDRAIQVIPNEGVTIAEKFYENMMKYEERVEVPREPDNKT